MNNNDMGYSNLFPEENDTPKVNMNDGVIPVDNNGLNEQAIVNGTNETPLVEEKIENSIDPINRDYVDERGNDASLSIEPTNAYNANLRNGENYKLSEAMKPSKNPFVKKRTRELKGVFGTDIGFRSNGFAGIISLAGLLTLAVVSILYFTLRF